MDIRDPYLTLDEFKKKSRKRAKKKDLEAAVLKECIAFLLAHKQAVYVERRNTGAVQFEDGGYIAFGAGGAADIWCLVRTQLPLDPFNQGRTLQHSGLLHVEIECKRRDGKGKLSEGQKAFKQFCAEQGIPYFVVTSAESMGKQLHEAGILT